MTAVANVHGDIRDTPARITKILNGAGGGRIAGTSTASMPKRLKSASAFAVRGPLNRLRSSASPPLRPMAYITKQPASDPSVDIAA